MTKKLRGQWSSDLTLGGSQTPWDIFQLVEVHMRGGLGGSVCSYTTINLARLHGK